MLGSAPVRERLSPATSEGSCHRVVIASAIVANTTSSQVSHGLRNAALLTCAVALVVAAGSVPAWPVDSLRSATSQSGLTLVGAIPPLLSGKDAVSTGGGSGRLMWTQAGRQISR
jgi:hypothetical protein